MKIKSLARIVIVAAVLTGAAIVSPSQRVLAACTAPATTYGTDTVTYSVPAAGTYRVWSRIQAPDAASNSYYLQVDGGCAITVGDLAVPANSLVWVDYQNATASSKIDLTLTAGSHTFVLTGREPGVFVDRVVFSSVASCVPTDTGDNCAIAATPTPTPTPIAGSGDINGDGKVNVLDLSALLAKWGTSDAAADLNHDGTVNVLDLSKLLASWTG
jgi:hypothetical protein